MATPQLSPGVLIREIDLTVGRAENVVDSTGGIAGPFVQGPVDEVVDITTQQDLLKFFGKPQTADSQYEYWMSASSYLSYGGTLKVVRTDGTNLKNAAIGYTAAEADLKIKNFDDYEDNYADNGTFHFAAKDPGSWANDLKVCVIDNKADQILTVNTSNPVNEGIVLGAPITAPISDVVLVSGVGATSVFNGYLKGIVTGVTTNTAGSSKIDVKVLSRVSDTVVTNEVFLDTVISVGQTADQGDTTIFVPNTAGIVPNDSRFRIDGDTTSGIEVISVVADTSVELASGIGATIQPGTAVDFLDVVTTGGEETRVTYGPSAPGAAFEASSTISVRNDVGVVQSTLNATSIQDWYDQQTLGLDNSIVYWNTLAPKPVDNIYASDRGGENDAINIAVVDDNGSVTGIKGNILEKYVALSKGVDSVSNVDSPRKNFFQDYLANFSEYVYSGGNAYTSNGHLVTPVATGFTKYNGDINQSSDAVERSNGGWGTEVADTIYNAVGAVTFKLDGGKDYSGTDNVGGYESDLGDLNLAYDLFANEAEVDVDFLMMGPGLKSLEKSQAKANKLISIAEARKDCIATISPHRNSVLGSTNSATQTNNILEFYSVIASSSYAVLDSGYKYTFDNFNNKFRYVPTNADVAGMMARTTFTDFPWSSPAGTRRGVLNNAIKLAYNPSKTQRDSLYGARINAISNQPGTGIVLFGDKTALSYASAFDRINVRRLFLNVEQTLKGAAEDQLFEVNDGATRSAFVNIVDPFLRDVRSNGGLIDYRVICDETNNPPSVVDNNEFRADIFLKPTRSINFVTLSFIATASGVSFEEVAGF